MNGLFFQATTFNQNISSWDVSKVTDMNNMFRGIDSSKFNQNIGSWDVSKVTEMGGMFFQATSFNQNIGSWNVSNVTNMSSMFAFAKLSIANYDSLLIGWSTITSSEDSLKQGVAFDAGSSKYCNGASARASIISNYGWTIKDGGLDCPILGVEELESSKLKIYPIPTNNIINIEGLNKNENNTIQVFDVQGKLVITKTITEKGAIDLSELNKGVYVIKIGEIAQRIVKM
jgi:surface protein